MSYLLYAQFLVFSFGLFLLICAVESENKKKTQSPQNTKALLILKMTFVPTS